MGTTFAGIEVSSKRHLHLTFRDEFLLSSIIFIIITIDNFLCFFLNCRRKCVLCGDLLVVAEINSYWNSDHEIRCFHIYCAFVYFTLLLYLRIKRIANIN